MPGFVVDFMSTSPLPIELAHVDGGRDGLAESCVELAIRDGKMLASGACADNDIQWVVSLPPSRRPLPHPLSVSSSSFRTRYVPSNGSDGNCLLHETIPSHRRWTALSRANSRTGRDDQVWPSRPQVRRHWRLLQAYHRRRGYCRAVAW